MMFRRSSLLALAPLALLLACSSKEPAQAAADTAPVEDTEPPQDAAPWNTYPEAPYYGVKKGEVYPNLQFEGYRDSTGEWTTLSMQDYYDPDGTRGITAIYLVVSAVWCGPCNVEADDIPNWYDKIKARGGRIITTLRDSATPNKPATKTHLDLWIDKHKLTIDSVIDPLGLATKTVLPGAQCAADTDCAAYYGKGARCLDMGDGVSKCWTTACTTNSQCASTYGPCATFEGDVKACWPDALRAWPYNMVINPRTMQVVSVKSGIDPATNIGCKTSDDCCHPGGERLGIDVDSSGAKYCSKAYVCTHDFNDKGTCVEPRTQAPIPPLETLMLQNGATPVTITDAGRDAPAAPDTGSPADTSVSDTATSTDSATATDSAESDAAAD